jgi:hypothetical protein
MDSQRFEQMARKLHEGVVNFNDPSTMKTKLSSIKGTVKAYLINPKPEVDGLLLSDGKQLHLPPHLSTALQQAVQPGDAIQGKVEPGFPSTFGQEFPILSVTNSRSMPTVVDRPPVTAPSKPEPEQSLSVQGIVDSWLVGHKGEPKGLILSDRTQLPIPHHLRTSMAAQVKIGEEVSAQGKGTCNNLGRSLAIATLSVNGQPLQELSGEDEKCHDGIVEHHEKAAKHHHQAAKHYKAGDSKMAGHHARKADEHHQQAMQSI